MIRFSLTGVALLVCLAVVVALTTLPLSVNIIRVIRQIVVIQGHPNANDALGHAFLYGTLMAVGYWALRRGLRFTPAFCGALATALLLGALTELSQQFTPGRTMTLSDLLANWLGAMSVAALIGYRRSARNAGHGARGNG
ncbi:MAG: VanZ family protein [Chloroflexota bacterium]